MAKDNKRLLSLDILRGMTIAGMLLVNNPGTWSYIYRPLEHADWIGLTPTDLVFPFFVFCMGVSMAFSLKKFNYKVSGPLMKKIVIRTVVLFLIGWAVQWFGHLVRGLCKGDPFSEAVNNLDSLRYLGVFPRLALVYFFGSVCAVLFKRKFIPWLVGIILVVYALILGFGNGYDFSLENIIAQIDNSVLGTDHMYHEWAYGEQLSFDPEGILSTLPCIAHVLIGYLVGRMILSVHNNTERVTTMLLWGSLLVLAGWLLQYGIPCGKKMWSSTFVLITCGMAMCIQAMLSRARRAAGHASLSPSVSIRWRCTCWARYCPSCSVPFPSATMPRAALSPFTGLCTTSSRRSAMSTQLRRCMPSASCCSTGLSATSSTKRKSTSKFNPEYPVYPVYPVYPLHPLN